MILAVASGKGGTGKTTVSVNLSRAIGSEVFLLDCDVEEPNAHLFLQGSLLGEEAVSIPVPRVDELLCDGCGKCGQFCEYNAIVSYGSKPIVFAEMCHGCGGCKLVCPRKAISEINKRIGVVGIIKSKQVTLVQGRLDVGVSMAPPLIRAVRKKLPENGAAILDAPPGTSCPVISAIRDTDFVILVTEPTPFGLHDLKLSVELVRELALPLGVVVNRYGVGDDRVHDYCRHNDIPILKEIPEDRRIAEAYSRGELIVDALPEYQGLFLDLMRKIEDLVEGTTAMPARAGIKCGGES
jgi:MinD superfamily P-loop ATPase